MPDLPDVPQQSWQAYSADRWFKQSTDRINSIAQMPTQPGLGFLSSTQDRINSLQVTPPVIAPPVPVPIPIPQQPTLPPIQAPVPVPAPAPAPGPAPTPAPAPPPSLPPIGLPPSPAPLPPVAPPTTEAPPQGLPMPQMTVMPQLSGGQPELPTPPTFAPKPVQTTTTSPFGGEASGPFAPGTSEKYVPPTTGGGGGSGGGSQIGYDPSAPAMQALNAAPQGDLQNYARQAANKAGINPELFAAQIQQESGYNPNAGSPAGAQGVAQIVPKYHPGVDTSDPYASLDYAANLMSSLLKQYNGDWSKALIAYNGGGGAVAAWDSGQPYQESQTYVARILGSSRPTEGTITPPSQNGPATVRPQATAGTTSQFGDRELSSDEAYAACGPAAAVRFASAYGRNPTLREAVDLAKQVGWSPQQGMAGIGSEQRLMASMGIPTKLVGTDVEAMAKEAQTGNPVVISTPGHYFMADGFNPQTGAFHVGQSGLDLKGGSEWMTPSQMQTVMGPIQGALFADNPQVPASSTSAPLSAHLDQTRRTLSADLTGKPMPRQAMTQFGTSADPQLQQLDQAVQDVAQPRRDQGRPAYLSIFDQQPDPSAFGAPPTGGSGGNPFDQLGQTISNAIRSALGGGRPPGGPRRPEDQTQPQDQSQVQQDDVATRARRMIEQLQTLPGGGKLGDVVGVPDLLPPDLHDKSIQDALLEAMNRGNQLSNLTRPSLGPGGLGLFDPRLGNDPRLEIPDIVEPISHAGQFLGDLTGLGRGTSERAATALDRAFEAEASVQGRGLTGGISQSALDALRPSTATGVGAATGAPSRLTTEAQQLIDTADRGGVPGFISSSVRRIAEENGVRITPDMTPNDVIEALRAADQPSAAESAVAGARAAPGEAVTATTPNARVTVRTGGTLPSNLSPIQQIVRDGQDSMASGLSRTRGQQVWDSIVRNLTDSGTDLNNIEKAMAERLGRPLTDSERVGLLARVDPTHQAETMVQLGLGRDMRAIGDQALPDWYQLAEAHTNRSAAEGLARQAEQQTLQAGIAPSTESRLSSALEDWNAAKDALDEAQSAATNPRTRASIGIDTAQRRVDDARAQLEAAAEVARQVNADAAQERVMGAQSSKVTTLPQYRDLAIAENNARTLNQQYDRLYQANPDNPYLQRLGQQVGRAEDRVSQLRSQMGETSATREQAITTRAQTAADAAYTTQPRYNQTPEYASANVKLRYEQQNLERLQTQQARGVQGLADDVARAEKRVGKAHADVQQAQADLPAAAKAQYWAQLHGREFAGPNGQTFHYDDVMKQIADLEAKYANQPEKWQQMQQGLSSLQDLRKQMLQEKVDHGLISQDAMDGLLKAYDFWTPTNLTEFMTDQRPGQGLSRGSSFNVGTSGLHSYTPEGSSGAHENHVAAMIREVYGHKSGIAKNDVNQALIKGFGTDSTVMRKVADSVKEYVDAGGKDSKLLHPDYHPRANEERITAMVDGKRQDYVTDNKLLIEALKQTPSDSSMVKTIAQAPAKFIRMTATERNPAFVPLNIARDTFSYALRNMTEQGTRGMPGNIASAGIHLGPAAITAAMTDPNDPNRGEKIAGALALGMGTRVGIGKNLGLGPSAAKAWLKAFGEAFSGFGTGRVTGEGAHALDLAGGRMGGGGVTGRMTEAQAQEQLRLLTRQNAFTVRNGGDLKQLLGDVAGFGWVKAINDRFEQVPRIASRDLALQRGASPLEAMRKARDVTMDFNRGGRFTREVNRYIPFFNVGAQAPAQLGRMIREHPGAAILSGLTLLGAPASATEAWNYADPQRAKDYEDTPDYMKRLGITIMVPGDAPTDANGNRVPQKIFMPIPNEFMPFVEAGREAFHRTQDLRGATDQGTSRGAGDLASTFGQELSPLGSLNVTQSTLPPLGTIGQLKENRDYFRDSTIANQYSDQNASNLSKGIAPLLENAVTQLPGMSSARVRPSQVDFAIKDVLSGLGQQGLNLTDWLSQRQPRVPGTASEIPLVGSMASRFVRGTGGQERQDEISKDAMLKPDIRQQLRSLGGKTQYYEPTPVPSDIQKIPLRQDEQVEYQRQVNQLFDENLRRVKDTPAFKDELLRDYLLTQSMDNARTLAQARVLRQIRESGSNIVQRYMQQSSAA